MVRKFSLLSVFLTLMWRTFEAKVETDDQKAYLKTCFNTDFWQIIECYVLYFGWSAISLFFGCFILFHAFI